MINPQTLRERIEKKTEIMRRNDHFTEKEMTAGLPRRLIRLLMREGKKTIQQI